MHRWSKQQKREVPAAQDREIRRVSSIPADVQCQNEAIDDREVFVLNKSPFLVDLFYVKGSERSC
jgi:hypothetical protein